MNCRLQKSVAHILAIPQAAWHCSVSLGTQMCAIGLTVLSMSLTTLSGASTPHGRKATK